MENAAVMMDLQALPEGCVANVISLTTPRDACRLSLISRDFKSAADSDAVWDKFLPHETNEIETGMSKRGLLVQGIEIRPKRE